MAARKTLRTRLVRLMYRIFSPRHPRGWIEVDWEETGDGTVRLFTEGLGKFDLPELEILDCPADKYLLGYCHGMMYNAVGALQLSRKDGRPIKEGDVVDLRSEEDDQCVFLRLETSAADTFRLADLDPSPDQFPGSATAIYILNEAERMAPTAGLRAADLAAEIHAKDFDYEEIHPSEGEMDAALAQSNCRAYYTISTALLALGRDDEARAAAEEAVARAPYFVDEIRADLAGASDLGPIDRYLADVDPWEVQNRYRRKSTGN